MKRGQPLQRKTPLRSKPFDRPPSKGPRPSGMRRKAMRRKRASTAETSEFWAIRREQLYARAGGRCEVGGCSLDHQGMEAHHRRLRSQGPDHCVENLLAVCKTHHDEIHAGPAAAREAGWIVSAWRNPAEVPVLLHDGGELFLTPDGTYSAEPRAEE